MECFRCKRKESFWCKSCRRNPQLHDYFIVEEIKQKAFKSYRNANITVKWKGSKK